MGKRSEGIREEETVTWDGDDKGWTAGLTIEVSRECDLFICLECKLAGYWWEELSNEEIISPRFLLAYEWREQWYHLLRRERLRWRKVPLWSCFRKLWDIQGKVKLSRTLWGSWAQKPFCVSHFFLSFFEFVLCPHFLIIGNRRLFRFRDHPWVPKDRFKQVANQ